MNKPEILIIEDDTIIRNLLTTALELNGYRYYIGENGKQGLMEALQHKPDLLLLDLGLPDYEGLDIIKKVRSWSSMPIIVVSARSEDSDKIEALNLGADDYLTKPFNVEELLARIQAMYRRTQNIMEPQLSTFINGDLRIDYFSGCTYINNQEIHLTPIEYKLLCLLSKNIDKVLTHNFLIKEIWVQATAEDIATLRVFMATLRKKIEGHVCNRKYIQTHIGIGYRMVRIDK